MPQTSQPTEPGYYLDTFRFSFIKLKLKAKGERKLTLCHAIRCPVETIHPIRPGTNCRNRTI